jgi:hypothetical protein
MPPKIKFKRDTTPVKGRPGGEPPAWAVATIIGIIALVVLITTIDRWDDGATLHRYLPFSCSGYFYPALIFFPMVAMIALMIVSKSIDFSRAKHWLPIAGRIVRSEMETRRHRFANDAEKIVNVPAVEYEFEIGGRTVRGSRLGIGDDSGGANSEATLARYPLGGKVTVYYDPDDPKSCVLERGGPLDLKDRKMQKSCAGGLLILALLGGAIWWLIARGPAFVAAQFPKSEPELVVFVFCFGLALLLFFIGMVRYQRRASHWPIVRGKIVTSTVESYQERSAGSNGRTSTMYRPVVEFAYAVHGRSYQSKQIKLMTEISGSQGYAEKVAAKYPQGRDVDVHYDPADPGNAALENPAGMAFIVLVMALAMFAIAVWKTGILDG